MWLTEKPVLEDNDVILLPSSSEAAYRFPRELASLEFMETLNGKHMQGKNIHKVCRDIYINVTDN